MYCRKCGHENDPDARYCVNCGADLGSTHSQKATKGVNTTNKILIVVVIVLIFGVLITVGMLFTNPASVDNSHKEDTGSSNDFRGPELFDSGSMKGSNAKYQDGPFTYQWETYKIDEENYVMYGTYVAGSKTVRQTVTLRKYGTEYVEITTEPKSSGKSSWCTVTSLQGYPTVEDYYWGIFRPGREQAGPVS